MIRNRISMSGLIALLAMLGTAPAQAQYVYFQPDGTGIPRTGNLQDYFDAQGESLDAVQDASLVPETFFPALELTFTLIAEGASYENVFGWYNVGDDVTLEENRHAVFFTGYNHGYSDPCDGTDASPVPPETSCNQRTVTLCGHPDWKGGPIGFFLVSPEGVSGSHAHNDVDPDYGYIYYSEPRLNILEQNQAEPYIHHLVYQSTLDDTAFYFGFEDLFRGGDNDFEDMLILVEGLLVSAPVENCNDADDDCDGLTDENVTESCSTACGTGVRVCESGAFGDCSAPEPVPEQCNGNDDDCDGVVDEDLLQPCNNQCGDGVEYCVNGSWVGCSAPEPGLEECDNLDNDCDNETDEDLTRDCSSICGDGTETCQNGNWVDCTADLPWPESCDGLDNDCDGATDEDLILDCSTACGSGHRYCLDGSWTDCDAVLPEPERCDDLDNDCDGETDEVWPDKWDLCENQIGGCSAYGRLVCNTDQNGLVCDGDISPEEEVCDFVDNDCDGAVDESDPHLGEACGDCEPGEEPPCYLEIGVCQPGALFCVDGELTCLGEVEPDQEVCDGLDNDCDGETDENAVPEICDDGIDNDCDGMIDLFDPDCSSSCNPGDQEVCGISEGDCEEGLRICGPDGNWGDCQGAVGPTPEVCDDRDNDCDGLTDEDAVPEICDDGIDNDCDGLIDAMDPDCGECTPGESRQCGEDTGECRQGIQSCNAQGHWGECAGFVGPQPELCDGLDNDCDGLIDEGHLCEGYDVCLCGECASPCSAGECPAGDLTCVNDWCVSDPCCGITCPPGEICGANGICQDPCLINPIDCEPDEECRMGECVPIDCFTGGNECPVELICVEGTCQPDPCAGVDCPGEQYCHRGECLEVGCDDCGAGQVCLEGSCQDSPCAGINCEAGQICVNGECAADPCQGVFCDIGTVCVNGQCRGDPCRGINCPPGSVCRDGYCAAEEDPGEDGGTDGGVDGSAGGDTTLPDAGTDGSAGDSQPADPETASDDDQEPASGEGGCGCASTRGSGGTLALVFLIGLLSIRRKLVVLLLPPVIVGLSGCSSGVAPATDGGAGCSGPADCQEGFHCVGGKCLEKPACTDLDADGFCGESEGGPDCNDNRSDIHPQAEEICDNLDNDCDGSTDEACPCLTGQETTCGIDTGICRKGVRICQDGAWGPCQDSIDPEDAENCDDELDNDCNGVVNDGCPCSAGDSRSCGSGVGECTPGVQHCEELEGQWRWGDCRGGTPPVDEDCSDELDNDCDGAVNNGCPCDGEVSRRCGLNVGICYAGIQHCQAGTWGACLGAGGPEDEICDGLDNDCDRLTDESCACLDGIFQGCGEDTGECQRGVQLCSAGQWGSCEGQVVPRPELCDGRDNDCDGEADEDFPDLRLPCEAGLGVCARPGIFVCNPDLSGTACSATPGSGSDELCDSLDNDCDGETDEDFPDVGGDCNMGLGECQDQGSFACGPNGGVICNANPEAPQVERCDGLDNDCDGLTDENFQLLGLDCFAGLGQCQVAGVFVCTADQLSIECDAVPETSDPEVCDGSDNDCDGSIDEGLTRACTNDCGSGLESCSAGEWAGCTAPQPYGEICDGLDNDCDGRTDEDFDFDSSLEHCGGCMMPCDPPHGTGECVLGVCAVAGCDSGFHDLNHNAVDGCEYACTPSGPEACNGVDDDCDGGTDNNPSSPTINCLDQGVCANVQPLCRNGEWVCSYPDVYQADETLCDDLDNDCDGDVDEGFWDKNTPCSAGQGVCRQNGVRLCTQDGLATSCSASPDWDQQAEELCDNLDNDCDGVVDNNIPVDAEMLAIDLGGRTFFIDIWEASRPDASATSPGYNTAYACSRESVLPWDDISWDQARAACEARGKRLCTDEEWRYACGGDPDWWYPYADNYQADTCNEFDQHQGILPTGQLTGCASPFSVLDLSGNVAEWADCADARDCRFVKPIFGGDYDDSIDVLVTCWFRNNAGSQYHQLGVGFRCCRD